MIVQHYKGGIYEIIIPETKVAELDLMNKVKEDGVLRGQHTETGEIVFAYRVARTFYTQDESLVFYRNEYGKVWARPYDMFWQWGYFTDKHVLEPRFSRLQDMEFKNEYLCEWV